MNTRQAGAHTRYRAAVSGHWALGAMGIRALSEPWLLITLRRFSGRPLDSGRRIERVWSEVGLPAASHAFLSVARSIHCASATSAMSASNVSLAARSTYL